VAINVTFPHVFYTHICFLTGKAQAAAGKMEARAAEDVAMAKKMGDYSETPSHAFNVPTSQGGEMELTSAGTKTQAGLTSEAQKVTRPVI